MPLCDELDQLPAFLAISETRTLRAAAARLHVTQPALTKLIQRMELACGAELVIRGRNGTQLTLAGKHLAAFAARTLKAAEDVEKQLRFPADAMAGHLRVGAYASLAEYLWPSFIPALKKEAPHLSLSIFTGESMSHETALGRGEIDLLVDAEPRLPAESFLSFTLYEDRFQLYSTQKRTELKPGAHEMPLVFSPGAFDEKNLRILDHLERAGYPFAERIELDSFTAVLAFAKGGVGLAVLPQRLAASALKSGEIHAVAAQGIPTRGFGTHHFKATIQESRRQDPRLRFLVRRLREWFRD